MAYSILSPRNSFVQFAESSVVTSCNFPDIALCLPVFDDDDVYFQFVIQATTEQEADALCDLTNELVSIGITKSCDDPNVKIFTQKPDRYRISTLQVLYNWSYGFPGFKEVINVADCFNVRVTLDDVDFCSNCFQRIGDDCHTSVLQYGNDENAYGFNYCNSEGIDTETGVCDPTFVTFTNQATLNIPYTAGLQAKYGLAPTIKAWLYDESGELVNMSIRQAFNTYPPTELRFDFGGPASGVIKIS